MDTLHTEKRANSRRDAAIASKEKILQAATRIFSKYGYAGGSIEKISKTAKTNDRMIYYYYGSKEQLYIATLEHIYMQMHEAEERLSLPMHDPVTALKSFIQFMWLYYQNHPEFVTLLNTENLYQGKYIAKSKKASEYSLKAVSILDNILSYGRAQDIFRSDLSGRDAYLLISSLTYFYLSNRYTLSSFLDENLNSDDKKDEWLDFITNTVLHRVTSATQ